ncbi:hypothetical protein [Streptomyces luteireticuli]|uniref:Uncharacterized protein n=1 Tax=Streptomyces luteireticuli TaxID=173858 RepID=A0ABN0YQS3_9ACTN
MATNRSAGDRQRRRDLYDTTADVAPPAHGLSLLAELLDSGLVIDWDGSAVRVLGTNERRRPGDS